MGKVIALEGIDGSGKSSLSLALIEELRKDGPVSLFRFPSPDSTFRRYYESDVRGKVTDHQHRVLGKLAIGDFVEKKKAIEEAAAEGVVILDRYWLSTLVYNGARLQNEATQEGAAKPISLAIGDDNQDGCQVLIRDLARVDTWVWLRCDIETGAMRSKKARASFKDSGEHLKMLGRELQQKHQRYEHHWHSLMFGDVLLSTEGDSVEIDTTHLKIEEAVKIILDSM